ncbi:RagB/SusD family nutrient uptake outer membrane protein [Hoylesella oralis]|uniref:RagB/SusD family nutrient uptake outer membrane protein n=1 Tax=Hoylesella oralis TaxID=28134 RepID=UPI00360C10FB
MKKIFLFSVCISVLLASCSDFLEEKPKSLRTMGDFYKTEAQATANVNTLYRSGAVTQISSAPSAYIGSFATVPGMLTGYFSNSYEGQESVCMYSRLLTRQEQTNNVSSTMDGVWDGCYGAINIANGAIKHIPDISMTESVKNTLVAEAKFFRAFNYFFLVKIFGDIPLSVEPYESMDNMELSRTSVADVYTQIEKDLTEAIAVLPAATWQATSHRITKYVAEQTLTAVYMQQGKYAEAAATAKDIIGSGLYSLTQNTDNALNSAYNKLRTTDDLAEVIYAVEYNASISTSDWRPTYAFTSSATAVFSLYSIYERVYGPNARFLNVYTANDLRGQEKQFFATTYTNPNNGKTWTAPDADHKGCWYYFDEEANLSTGKGTKDWNIYRYAETLLDAAECIVQSGGSVTAEAAGYLAQVQSRALGQSVATLTTSLQSLSKDDFIHACWTERLREFPLEYKIWDDCLRTKMFPNVSSTIQGSVTYENLVGATNGSGAVFKESDLLWPLSLNEMQRNKNLRPQNTGYADHN